MHQLSLIEPDLEPGWTPDDWQTPAAVASPHPNGITWVSG